MCRIYHDNDISSRGHPGTLFATNVDERQISGMGVGLYVVREIVALHGGDVCAASVEGEGSAFTVVLPLAPPAATSP